MKNENLSGLPIVPEEYEAFRCNRIDWTAIHSEMTEAERRFINGLIAYYEPHKILEVGVMAGGGTINILNAIGTYGNNAQVISVDHAVSGGYGYDANIAALYSDVQIGHEVKKHSDKLPLDKWRLITGKDPSEVMDEIGSGIDFAIIDTAHYHPVESLNFLCILPFLADGAIVVVHDIMQFNEPASSGHMAPRILMSALAADKLSLAESSQTQDFNANIVAVQLTSETKKYIRNVFDALFIPWGKLPDETDLQNMRLLITKHYSSCCTLIFDKALQNNRNLHISGKLLLNPAEVRKHSLLKKLFSDSENLVIFYGAGFLMRSFLDSASVFESTINAKIWDMDAENIGEIYGVKVSLPDFQTEGQGKLVIIMIGDCDIANKVRKKFELLGYIVFHGIKEYLLS